MISIVYVLEDLLLAPSIARLAIFHCLYHADGSKIIGEKISLVPAASSSQLHAHAFYHGKTSGLSTVRKI